MALYFNNDGGSIVCKDDFSPKFERLVPGGYWHMRVGDFSCVVTTSGDCWAAVLFDRAHDFNPYDVSECFIDSQIRDRESQMKRIETAVKPTHQLFEAISDAIAKERDQAKVRSCAFCGERCNGIRCEACGAGV